MAHVRHGEKVRKAVFPVAGMGTRFLPATKANPKEMLPVVDKPLIQYAVEEAYAAGVRHMIFVTGRSKRAIEDHFDMAYELETELEEIKNNKIYENAFEWRFEFPEVLNDEGDFIGFDVVIGNPPYVRQELFKEIKKDWKFGNMFTSSISNFNISAPFHRDTGNLEGTVNIILTKRNNANGGCLNVPDYNATFEQADNSMLVYPAWRNVHGVTPIKPIAENGYRNSLIFYPLKAFKGI